MRCIESGRVTLEPQTVAHADEMFMVLADPAIYEFENAPPQSIVSLRARFSRLEVGRSSDGRELWLNWVIRSKEIQKLIGYVQATVRGDGDAAIAYELASAFWGCGLAREAVQAMLGELARDYNARCFSAVLKQRNHRSRRLLDRLGFTLAPAELHVARHVDPDEWLMLRNADSR